MDRNLDGYYFRTTRNDKVCILSFSDLTTEERYNVMRDKDKEWLMSLCDGIAGVLRNIGNELDIYYVKATDENCAN